MWSSRREEEPFGPVRVRVKNISSYLPAFVVVREEAETGEASAGERLSRVGVLRTLQDEEEEDEEEEETTNWLTKIKLRVLSK